ncbi:hypothetical protein [Vibrio palustris]|nr:hypothetical protein [Vibrio palustris]
MMYPQGVVDVFQSIYQSPQKRVACTGVQHENGKNLLVLDSLFHQVQ